MEDRCLKSYISNNNNTLDWIDRHQAFAIAIMIEGEGITVQLHSQVFSVYIECSHKTSLDGGGVIILAGTIISL